MNKSWSETGTPFPKPCSTGTKQSVYISLFSIAQSKVFKLFSGLPSMTRNLSSILNLIIWSHALKKLVCNVAFAVGWSKKSICSRTVISNWFIDGTPLVYSIRMDYISVKKGQTKMVFGKKSKVLGSDLSTCLRPIDSIIHPLWKWRPLWKRISGDPSMHMQACLYTKCARFDLILIFDLVFLTHPKLYILTHPRKIRYGPESMAGVKKCGTKVKIKSMDSVKGC